MSFEAACANCARYAGGCTIGREPPAGEPRCDGYEISDLFASQIAGAFLAANPIRAPVPLRSLSSAERKRAGKRGRAPPRRGFRR